MGPTQPDPPKTENFVIQPDPTRGLADQCPAVVRGLGVLAFADYPHPRASDPRITGIQSPACNTQVNEQSQSAEFYVTYRVQKSKVTTHKHNLFHVTTKLQNVRKIQH